MDGLLTLSFTGVVDDPRLGAALPVYGHARLDPAAAPARTDPLTGEAIYVLEGDGAVLRLGDEVLAPTTLELRVGNNLDVNGAGILFLDTLVFEARSTVPGAAFGVELGIGAVDLATLRGPALPAAATGLADFDGSFGAQVFAPARAPGLLAAETTRFQLSEGRIGAGLSEAEARFVALLYEAALDRDGAIDREGLNFWIDAREDGLSRAGLARAFLLAPEFEAAFGAPATPAELVPVLYANVLDRPPDAAGLAFWQGVVADPAVDAADLLVAFAASAENVDGSPLAATLVEVAPGDWDFL